MGSSIIIVAGLATFLNLAVIYSKFQNGNTSSAVLDALVLSLTFWLFSGTLGALAIGTIASALFSIFLWIRPPKTDLFEDW